MKFSILLFLAFFVSFFAIAQQIRFVHMSDTHIGSPNGSAEEDLRRTVNDINSRSDIEFVVITGDITELGTDSELRLAKQILDGLKVKWFIIPGNHDTGWSESGGQAFTDKFGYDKFVFEHKGIKFFGCPSGPYVRMSDGHVPRSSIIWIDSILNATSPDQPLIFLNHYPIDPGLDNWYEITDRLSRYRTLAILCGHGHANRHLNFDGIPGFMGRSNLRAKAEVGGYNIVDIANDSIYYTERRPGTAYLNKWLSAKLKTQPGLEINTKRPDLSINNENPFVSTKWVYSSSANVISTPLVADDLVVFGNQEGTIEALTLKDGKVSWSTKLGGPVYSSPAQFKKTMIVGSADGNIYCLNLSDGRIKWKYSTNASVLGSPLIENDIVFIGGSDGRFRALNATSGKLLWEYKGLEGPVVSTPVIANDMIIFGAWDRHLHALSKKDGTLRWKWNNGSTVRNYSPASCIPVVVDSTVFIVAPDRFITAIDLFSGKTLWRNNDATVRESIGVSEDKKLIYGKTMQDTIVAYMTSRTKQSATWKMHAGFGYEHAPSMLIQKKNTVYFGTRNGVVYAIDPVNLRLKWRYKIDNSMVNTLRVLKEGQLIVSTMDGKVAFIVANEQ